LRPPGWRRAELGSSPLSSGCQGSLPASVKAPESIQVAIATGVGNDQVVRAGLDLMISRTLFAEHQESIEQWQESEACMNAAEILRRLMALAAGRYHEGQLRSMERLVKEWRTARAERLLGSMRSAGKGTQTEEMTNPDATAIGGNT